MFKAIAVILKMQQSIGHKSELSIYTSVYYGVRSGSIYQVFNLLKQTQFMRLFKSLVFGFVFLYAIPVQAEKITIAVATSFMPAMNEIVALFEDVNKGDQVEAVYGASGRFSTQIRQGAPYDLFFSADTKLPQMLAADGFASGEVKPYAVGRIVLWSSTLDASDLALERLSNKTIRRIAIANPRHAPYGQRAVEMLREAGLWSQIEPKLIYGESISHAAQFAQSGNAQVGILPLSLVMGSTLSEKGVYRLVSDTLHQPLEQSFIVTKQAGEKAVAIRFAEFIESEEAQAVIARNGFTLPKR